MFTYHLNPNISELKATSTPGFFNTMEFQINQQYKPLYSFYILDNEAKLIYGFIHFTGAEKCAISQPRGPFGGFELNQVVSKSLFNQFIAFIQKELLKKGINMIRLVERPDALKNEVSFDVSGALSKNGFETIITDTGHYIDLDKVLGLPQIHPMQRRNFRKALSKNYQWRLESEESLTEVYHFIQRCRAQNNLSVNITFNKLKESFKRFPGNYRIFSVRYNGNLSAVCITVKIADNLLYNYLPASDKRFNSDSPMVFLLVNLYKYAKSVGYQVLDLGVSSVNGKVQTGLAEFKTRMGALIYEKKTFEKKL